MRDRALLAYGWWGYFLCAALYVISALLSGDILALLGSGFFLVATGCFMVVHYRSERERSDG